MLKVGITGGIGSGKSTVCQVFATLGIPVFNADTAARYLIENDSVLIAAIKKMFGDSIYNNGILNRKEVSAIVFQQPHLLQQLNGLVHPATITYGQQWLSTQTAPYAIKEAAIFFESGSNKDMDVMIGVSAPVQLRIQRAMSNINATKEEIEQRISRQMDESKKMALCDYVIINDDTTAIIPQVLGLHTILLQKAG